MPLDHDAELWFQHKRGITKDTLAAFKVESDGPAVVRFPYTDTTSKFRKGFEKDAEGGRKFWWDPPTQAGQVPLLAPGPDRTPRAILCEGETDTMRMWQAIPADRRDEYKVVGLSGVNAWKEHYAEDLFADAQRVFVVLDNDSPYDSADAAKAGEKAWKQIRGDLGNKARRITLPQGSKDVCEFFEHYEWAAFETLLDAANEPIRHYKRLDLDAPVPPVNWVIDNLIEAGIVTVFTGDGGVGKSFLAMSMAIAIASGDSKWVGQDVSQHGPVMYVDEEQAPDLVLQRLAALGLKKEHRHNIDYLNFAGVDLYNEPWKLLDEVIDLRPRALFIDSQSAVSIGAEENSNDHMTKLFRDSFRPLARETGCAVVILHHTTKDNKGAPRGASAIRNQADQVISVVESEVDHVTTGRLNIFASKPRRNTRMIQAILDGDMAKDGYVNVVNAFDLECA
jgi:hypothetical protein